MAARRPAASTADDNLDELFSGIGDTKKAPVPKTAKPPTAASKAIGDTDILADLESQLASATPTSRPHTPRLKETALRRSAATPPAAATPPTADDKRKSTDSSRSLRASFTPSATSSEPQESDKKTAPEPAKEQAAEGGWWGGIWNTANAAMKQAEAAYKEIQQNEEAKKWADQVRGFSHLDVGALKNYGDELRHRALPTFTHLLNTIAPPISSHERLMIHITHDFVGYPSLDPLIHGVFSRVMSQVEGGDLLVIQRGQESGSRRSKDSSAGWRDGPWWRQVDGTRELGLIKGLTEGTKLCRASAEGYANEYFTANGGLEQAKIRATEDLSETNPVRTSDLFLCVQAIESVPDKELFAGSASTEKEKEDSAVKHPEEADETVSFAIYIMDPVHNIEFSTISQSIPARWAHWLETSTLMTPKSSDEGQQPLDNTIPDEIKDIIDSGAVDPREWVAEWIEETLDLAIGVVAQRYVARRMGVGEGGLGKGKQRMEDVIQDNAGEAARAGLI